MARVRIQFDDEELARLIQLVEDNMIDVTDSNLLVKMNKAAISIGGVVSSGLATKKPAKYASNTKKSQEDIIEDINFKLMNSEDISEEEREFYLNVTGVVI